MYATKRFREAVLSRTDLNPTPRNEYFFSLPPIENNPISGWHAHVIDAGGYESMLFVHNATRFPVLMPAFGEYELSNLHGAFFADSGTSLHKYAETSEHNEVFHQYKRPLAFTGTYDRKVQGALNIYVRRLEHIVNFHELDLGEMTGGPLSAMLADTFTQVNGKYVSPGEEMLRLVRSLQPLEPLLN